MLDFFGKENIIKIKNYYYICFGMKEHRIERSFSHEQKFEGKMCIRDSSNPSVIIGAMIPTTSRLAAMPSSGKSPKEASSAGAAPACAASPAERFAANQLRAAPGAFPASRRSKGADRRATVSYTHLFSGAGLGSGGPNLLRKGREVLLRRLGSEQRSESFG